MNTYTLSENLMQAVVSTLNEMPAARVRGLLNAIEAECVQQDQARADKAAAEQREAIKAELQAAVQTPAPAAADAPAATP